MNRLNVPCSPAAETLYVEPGVRHCRIFALRGPLRPGQSPEALLAAQGIKEVGMLDDGRITMLDKKYWPTADETRLTAGMLLEVREPAAAVVHVA
jgi:hypothetical protein